MRFIQATGRQSISVICHPYHLWRGESGVGWSDWQFPGDRYITLNQQWLSTGKLTLLYQWFCVAILMLRLMDAVYTFSFLFVLYCIVFSVQNSQSWLSFNPSIISHSSVKALIIWLLLTLIITAGQPQMKKKFCSTCNKSTVKPSWKAPNGRP